MTGKSFSKLTTFPFLLVKETLFLSFEKQFFRCWNPIIVLKLLRHGIYCLGIGNYWQMITGENNWIQFPLLCVFFVCRFSPLTPSSHCQASPARTAPRARAPAAPCQARARAPRALKWGWGPRGRGGPGRWASPPPGWPTPCTRRGRNPR